MKSDTGILAHEALCTFLKVDSPFKKGLCAVLDDDCKKLLRMVRFYGPTTNVELAKILHWSQPRVTRRVDRLRKKFSELSEELGLPEICIERTHHKGKKGLVLKFESDTLEDIQRCIMILSEYGRIEPYTDGSLLFVLDGITYSRVGELLFTDTGIEGNIFEQARAYQRSLEDFIFAVVISDSLGIDRDYWPIVGTRERHRVARTLLKKIIRTAGDKALRTVGIFGGESLLSDPAYGIIEDFVDSPAGDHIEEDLRSLAYVDWSLWMRLLEREATANMAPDNTLSQKTVQPSKFNIKKSYVSRDRFNKCFPPNLLSEGQKRIKTVLPDIESEDCQNLVIGAIVTHVCIGLYYACISESTPYQGEYQEYLPCETRATLITSTAKQRASQQHKHMTRLQRLMLPYFLAEILKHCQHRDQLVERAFDIRDTPKIAIARKRVCNVREAMETGKNKDVQTLVREINLATMNSETPSVLEQWVEVFDHIPHRARWAQQLVEGTREGELLNIQKNLAKIFPEIYGSKSIS